MTDDRPLFIIVTAWVAMQWALFLLVFFAAAAAAQTRQVAYETLPGTDIRDYRKPAIVVEVEPATRWSNERVTVYQTLPGTDVRDYNKKAYVVEKED
jgi:hypothetical protein